MAMDPYLVRGVIGGFFLFIEIHLLCSIFASPLSAHYCSMTLTSTLKTFCTTFRRLLIAQPTPS